MAALPVLNNTTMTTLPSIYNGITAVEFWIQTIVFYGGLGLLSLFGYFAVAIGIARSKTLRTRFFIIVWFLAVARGLASTTYIILLITRILRFWNISDMSMTQGQCYLIFVNFTCAITLESVMLLALVVDRIMAIATFKFYRTLTDRSAMIGCLVATAVSALIRVLPAIVWTDFGVTVRCINIISPLSDAYMSYLYNSETTLHLLVLILYLALMVYIKFWHMKKISRVGGDQSSMATFKHQARLLPFLRRTVLIHSCLSLATRMMATAATVTSGPVGYRVMIYTGFVGIADLFVNLIVILISSDDLRQASFPFCTKTTAPVIPLPKNFGSKEAAQGVRRCVD